ncbi:MAG: formylmethanofuran dehydrogenase [Firmicutes bacterium]|nr:formylmethanofuran dehydrogenase [Bacillota bacterium]
MTKKLWEKAVAFHGHECPGLAIGVRICEAAMEKMRIGLSADEEIVCVTENDACGVDAIQALLSCTVGKGNLLFRGTGKQAFSFFNRKTGEKLRIYLKAGRNQEVERAQWQEYLLNAPLGELFAFSAPKYDPPAKARIFPTIICELCGEGASENKMHLRDGKIVCADCFESYSRGW